MKRTEAGAVAFGIAVGIFLAAVILSWTNVFATSAVSNGASNFLGIVGAVPLIAALGIAGWARWHRSCAIPYCVRLGEHPVAKTLQKVCRHHHTLADHLRVHDLRGEEHRISGRLGWGESHAARFATKPRKKES